MLTILHETIAEIAVMTEYNNHTSARLELAKALDIDVLVEKYSVIETMNRLHNGLTQHASNMLNKADAMLFKYVDENVVNSRDVHEAF